MIRSNLFIKLRKKGENNSTIYQDKYDILEKEVKSYKEKYLRNREKLKKAVII